MTPQEHATFARRRLAAIHAAKQPPEQQRFSLLYRGRACRVYRTFGPTHGVPSAQVQIQFEDGHTAIVSRAEVMSPDGNYPFRGPDVRSVQRVPTVVPAETPAQHIRNALTILSLIEQQAPAFWALNPEFGRSVRRATAAVKLLETPAHYPPTALAAQHLRAAGEALCEAAVDWDVLPDVRVAVARLARALFQLDGGAR